MQTCIIPGYRMSCQSPTRPPNFRLMVTVSILMGSIMAEARPHVQAIAAATSLSEAT